MVQDEENIKRKLAELARQSDKRVVSFGPEEPSKWWPQNVKNPTNGEPFTCPGAWLYIAEQLELPKTVLEKIKLKKPPEKLAYVLLVKTVYGEIYIKIRLGKDRIIGRSFHYTERE